MSQSLDLCRLKLKRTNQQLQTLQGHIDRYLKRNPYRVFVDPWPQGDQYLVRAFIEIPPPEILGVLIGEIAHNARSALDNLAYALAKSHALAQGLPGTVPKGTEFAIFKDQPLFEGNIPPPKPPQKGSGRYKIRGIGPLAQAEIERLQPYHRTADPEGHPLWMLHSLNIGDKHREGDITGMVYGGTGFSISSGQGFGFTIAQGMTTKIGAFVQGAVLGALTFSGPNPVVDMQFRPRFGVAFSPVGPARGGPVIDTLKTLIGYIRSDVLPKLEPLVK